MERSGFWAFLAYRDIQNQIIVWFICCHQASALWPMVLRADPSQRKSWFHLYTNHTVLRKPGKLQTTTWFTRSLNNRAQLKAKIHRIHAFANPSIFTPFKSFSRRVGWESFNFHTKNQEPNVNLSSNSGLMIAYPQSCWTHRFRQVTPVFWVIDILINFAMESLSGKKRVLTGQYHKNVSKH